MRRSVVFALAVVSAWLLGGQPAWGQQQSGTKAQNERAELAKALQEARLPLERGISASEREGKPISAKYEVEDGKLQLSVYTMKGNQFEEVIVDHHTGQIVRAEPLSKPEDLTAAQQQREAMTRAKTSLQAAAEKAARANTGARVVSVMPTMKDGHPIAEITLAKGKAFKTVSEKLD